MPLSTLKITSFRNLDSVTLEPAPQFNIFYGDNGAGKTSLLEAIYYLGLGRSFRTHLTNRIIQHQADHFSVFAELDVSGNKIPMGLERQRDGGRRIRINGETANSLSQLAHHLPIQLMSAHSHRFFHEGPKIRRQFLDWGLFHVEQTFYPLWQQLQQVLKQRNAALKKQMPAKEIRIWDKELSVIADGIHLLRKKYIGTFEPILLELLTSLLPELCLELRYYRGWNKDRDLQEVLENNLQHELLLGYTQLGPQRADLQLHVGPIPAHDYLSQGQQKLAAYALHLAQGMLLRQLTTKNLIYLIDDLPSELDLDKRRHIIEILTKLNSQIFITTILKEGLSDLPGHRDIEKSMFHVKHGMITDDPI